MFDVTVIGSANLDLVVRTERHPAPGETVLGNDYAEYPGGKGLNQAVAAARSGARTAFVGAVGADDAGRTLEAVGAVEGIDLAHLTRVEHLPSGRALITVDTAGENSIVVVAGANARVGPPTPIATRVMLGQLEIPLDVVATTFRTARAVGATTILNPAPAPATGLPAELLANCDIVVPNEHEVGLLGGPEALFAAGVKTVMTTLGERGVEVRTIDGQRHRIAAPQVTVVDTTGAGDTFCGAFAARLALGTTILEAAHWAVAASALAVGQPGAIPSIPRAARTHGFVDELGR